MTRAPAPPPLLDAPTDAALAEAVAHELNNIGASLYGFVELAAESAPLPDSVAGCIAEMRVGVRRLQSVARVLEALAETVSEPQEQELGACIEAAAAGLGSPVNLRWRCDPTRRVRADSGSLGRALSLLGGLELTPEIIAEGALWSIEGPGSSAPQCLDCSASLPRRGARISVPHALAGRHPDSKIRRLHRAAVSRLTPLAGAQLVSEPPDAPVQLWLSAAGVD